MDYLTWEIAGRSIAFMAAESLGYFAIVLLSESRTLRNASHNSSRWLGRQQQIFWDKLWPSRVDSAVDEPVDDDVVAEERRVEQLRDELLSLIARRRSQAEDSPPTPPVRQTAETPHSMDDLAAMAAAAPPPPSYEIVASSNSISSTDSSALLIYGLEKTFPASVLRGVPAKHAVRGVSLGCAYGERVGLLGVNGAGKTTTVSVLTGELQRTAGDVFIGGLALDNKSAQMTIGYCPQVRTTCTMRGNQACKRSISLAERMY